jgi:hypothetical protein
MMDWPALIDQGGDPGCRGLCNAAQPQEQALLAHPAGRSADAQGRDRLAKPVEHGSGDTGRLRIPLAYVDREPSTPDAPELPKQGRFLGDRPARQGDESGLDHRPGRLRGVREERLTTGRRVGREPGPDGVADDERLGALHVVQPDDLHAVEDREMGRLTRLVGDLLEEWPCVVPQLDLAKRPGTGKAIESRAASVSPAGFRLDGKSMPDEGREKPMGRARSHPQAAGELGNAKRLVGGRQAIEQAQGRPDRPKLSTHRAFLIAEEC